MIKKLSVVIAILFLLVMSVGFSSAVTGAMGNARMVLYPEVNGKTNTIIEKSILVKNVNNEPINVTLQMDNTTEKFIELIDKSFLMEPNTEKKAQFIVRVKDEGTYTGKINVFFTPLEDKKTGVALSSEIVVIARKDQSGYTQSNDDSTNANENDENTDAITGNVIDGGKKSFFSGFGILMSAFFILLLTLIILIVVLSKKKGEKRRRKVNARKKV